MKTMNLEAKVVEQRNRKDLLEQQKQETELDIAMNRKINAMSLEERIKIQYDVNELKEKVNKIDIRLKKVEEKK